MKEVEALNTLKEIKAEVADINKNFQDVADEIDKNNILFKANNE